MLRTVPRTFTRARFGRMCMAVAACALASCAERQPHLPKPLHVPQASKDREFTMLSGNEVKRTALSSSEGLTPPVGRTLAEPFSSSTPPRLTGENIGVSFEGIKLPAFVNAVFGELLKVPFDIDSVVATREQLITLNIPEPLPPEQFFQVIRQVLANNGLSVIYQSDTKVYRIIEAATAKADVPQIVRNRALSTVPGDQRPIFYFAPIHNVQSAFMQGWLELALRDRVRFSGFGNANGLLLMGKREDINAALETLEILDQPTMAGSHSLKITPAFWSAGKLVEQLVTVLSAEGYSVTNGATATAAIRMIPIEALNTIIVFSTNETTLQHVLKWASDLDQPSQTINTQSMFYYPVENASASKIAALIGQVLGQEPAIVATEASRGAATAGATGSLGTNMQQSQGSTTSRPAISGVKQKLIVDETRNAIIFQGTAEEYAQFRNLLVQMDRAPLEVLIEATVAEVTLDKTESLGVVLGFNDGAKLAPNNNQVRSDTGLFATLLRSRGQISANLNALASNSRITVLSTPRLVTISGNAASIQVGQQVPIVTTQQTAPTGTVGGTSNILQDVQYRSTGINLSIKPTINSNRRVELTISQEVSSAAVNNVSDIDSPIIQQRSIQTTLSLGDGETALLGGLITENYNSGSSGVPYLKDIPILGNLFKNQSNNLTRTELIVILTPYIIDGPETSRAVLDAFKNRLGEWAHDIPVTAVDENGAIKAAQ